MHAAFLAVATGLSLMLLSPVSARSQGKETPDLTLRTVVIDPGHGGKDVGCVSADKKTYEKNLTLKISRKLAARIRDRYPDVKVIQTRDKDEFIPLNTRAKIASDAGAQLFLSVHINATTRSKNIHGFSAYILGPSTKGKYDSYEVNREVCKRENSVIYLEDDYSTQYKDYDDSPESQILLQLMQNAFREQSLALAETVSAQMEKGPFRRNWGVMQDNFAVLRRASMPAVLLELGYITNADDLALLRSEQGIEQIVDALFAAFVSYKEAYDKSVALEAAPRGDDKAAASPGGEPSARDAAALSATQGVFYGTQVLASARKMSPDDKFFKGLKVVAVPAGNLYKYIALPDEDPALARSAYPRVKKIFPDAFFVRVENGEVSRFKAQ